MAFSAEENAAIRETLLQEARRCAVTLGLRKTSVEQLPEAARTCCSRPAAAYPRSVR